MGKEIRTTIKNILMPFVIFTLGLIFVLGLTWFVKSIYPGFKKDIPQECDVCGKK